MQEPQAPAADEGEWVGLTWYGEDTFGTIRHGGGTNGQIAMLILAPQRGYALALLTNHSPGGLQVIEAMSRAAGIAPEERRPLEGVDTAGFAGVYETTIGRLTITTPDPDRIHIESESFGGFPTKDSPPGPPEPPEDALFYTPDRWYIAEGQSAGARGHFIRGEDGAVRWLRIGGRLYPRV